MIAPQTAIAPNRMKRTVSIVPLLLQQRVNREDKLLPGVVGGGEPPGVHPDGVARARFHAHAAEDAPEHIDVEPDRVLLHARVGRLPCHDRDALRRARRRAAEARHAPGSPVLPLHQPMSPPEPGRHLPPHLGVLDRLDPLLADDVGKEVPHRDPEPLHDLHEVQRLRERHLPRPRHFYHADRHRPRFASTFSEGAGSAPSRRYSAARGGASPSTPAASPGRTGTGESSTGPRRKATRRRRPSRRTRRFEGAVRPPAAWPPWSRRGRGTRRRPGTGTATRRRRGSPRRPRPPPCGGTPPS